MNEKDKIVTPDEAAKILNISAVMLRIYLRAGRFKTARKVRGTRWVIGRDEVEAIASGELKTDMGGASNVIKKRN